MARLTVEIPDKLHRELKLAAINKKTTAKKLVVYALEKNLQEQAQSTGTSVRRTDSGHLRSRFREYIGDGIDPVPTGSDSEPDR